MQFFLSFFCIHIHTSSNRNQVLRCFNNCCHCHLLLLLHLISVLSFVFTVYLIKRIKNRAKRTGQWWLLLTDLSWYHIRDKVFNSGPRKICGKQPLKNLKGVWSAISRPYPFKFFKGCLPQILLDPFLFLIVCKLIYMRATLALNQTNLGG